MCHSSAELVSCQIVMILQNTSFGYTIHTHKYENRLCRLSRFNIQNLRGRTKIKRGGQEEEREGQNSNTFKISHIFTKTKTLYKKYTSRNRGLWHTWYVSKRCRSLESQGKNNVSVIQHTHKAELWCCGSIPRSSEEPFSPLSVLWVCSLCTLLWGVSSGKPLLEDRPSRRGGPLSSGGVCGERRNLFDGGAEAAQSIWVVESCFSKTFAEPSEGGSGALTESMSGKSCAVAQKAASYSPNACSRVVQLSWKGEGAFDASLRWKTNNNNTKLFKDWN